MELAGKIFLGAFTLIFACIIAGFISAWWETRQRDKDKKG
ncbi:unnamed protein product [marine sediment metagenome]|uniref:Uncharacterized protein n=1 Tax=marine sediment metagenome TaxID=412755 RepID=X1RC97_9ZZZZ